MTESGRVLRLSDFQMLCHPGLVPGSRIETQNLDSSRELGRNDRDQFQSSNSQLLIPDFLATHGALPLPPYIEYTREKEADYQTSFARHDGSVAAPTASLHFTSELMDRIKSPKEYLTLHVGLGTFK
jgi:S-adenosylmethionine:tRNA ribosyltransferase-isomerase